MKQVAPIGLALAGVIAVSASRPAQDGAALGVNVVRSFRPASAQTVVDVFCRIPLQIVSPIGTTRSGAYRFSVAVRDSSGLALVSQSWVTPVRAEVLRSRGASTSEHLAFAARAGRYSVDVSVTDSATGRIARAQATAEAFARAPGGSDLLLGSGVRQAATPADTVSRAEEVRRGPLFLATSGLPVLTPQASKLAYYLELYPSKPESVSVGVRVLSDSGKPVVAAAPVPVAIGQGGGFANGVIDLAGLPPGRYRFEVTATGPDSQVVRVAPFGMTGFETIAEAAAIVDAGAWPGDMSEAQLDSAYEPLVYLMTVDEQGVYSGLTLEAKRKWLQQFWARRDPSPGTIRNEERERFYAAIAEADRRYREGGASAIPGWRTDRGRIYIKYGSPDEVLERKVQTGAMPYEIWKYTRQRNLKYVFMDLTRFGNYQLIYTDDRRERSRPDWQELMGTDGLKDLEQNN